MSLLAKIDEWTTSYGLKTAIAHKERGREYGSMVACLQLGSPMVTFEGLVYLPVRHVLVTEARRTELTVKEEERERDREEREMAEV